MADGGVAAWDNRRRWHLSPRVTPWCHRTLQEAPGIERLVHQPTKRRLSKLAHMVFKTTSFDDDHERREETPGGLSIASLSELLAYGFSRSRETHMSTDSRRVSRESLGRRRPRTSSRR